MWTNLACSAGCSHCRAARCDNPQRTLVQLCVCVCIHAGLHACMRFSLFCSIYHIEDSKLLSMSESGKGQDRHPNKMIIVSSQVRPLWEQASGESALYADRKPLLQRQWRRRMLYVHASSALADGRRLAGLTRYLFSPISRPLLMASITSKTSQRLSSSRRARSLRTRPHKTATMISVGLFTT